jgi:hypothetical protein
VLDLGCGDVLLGPQLERNRVYRVQQLPGGDLLVSWHAGNKVTGGDVFRPDEAVAEYADEFDMR